VLALKKERDALKRLLRDRESAEGKVLEETGKGLDNALQFELKYRYMDFTSLIIFETVLVNPIVMTGSESEFRKRLATARNPT
jgi:hypothetical protein